MKIINGTILTLIGLVILTVPACKKSWLDAKPQQSLVSPSTISDYQALLDNSAATSTVPATTVAMNNEESALHEIASGDFYMTDAVFNSSVIQPEERGAYTWAQDVFQGNRTNAWDKPYERIFFTNIVLEGIEKIIPSDNSEQLAWSTLKAHALFLRAYNHYSIAQHFCKPYDKNTAATDLGIPLKLQSDVNIKTVRASVSQTYSQILSDFKAALLVSPLNVPTNVASLMRPNKAAVNGMIARVYLAMSEYDSAYLYADRSLQLYNTLIDYNTVVNSNNPMKRFGKEELFHNTLELYASYSDRRHVVDSNLYRSYNVNDLRRSLFFRTLNGNIIFKGSYDGTSQKFSGVATDEMYLIRAECLARKGNFASAMNDLNTLLRNRWIKINGVSTYVDQTATDLNDALTKIMAERRKELCFRGLRWSDLRRLNKEMQFAVSLKHITNGQTNVLPPNDDKYVFPIPDYVISFSGVQQNPR